MNIIKLLIIRILPPPVRLAMGLLDSKYYKEKGVNVGNNVDIIDCKIDMMFPELISIGDNVTLTGVTLLTHDACLKKEIGFTRFGTVRIGNNVFVGKNTVILPNVEIGNNVIIGAGSVVTKSLPDNSVAAGSPCKVIGDYNNLLIKSKGSNCFLDIFPSKADKSTKAELIRWFENNPGKCLFLR